MRNEMQEPGRGMLAAATRLSAAMRSLEPSAVDAALDDETGAPVLAERGSRREFPARGADASRVAIDDSHAVAAHDSSLIGQLSRQLALLEDQQRQIRRLLDLTETRFASPGTANKMR